MDCSFVAFMAIVHIAIRVPTRKARLHDASGVGGAEKPDVEPVGTRCGWRGRRGSEGT
jgi:hypothetical protein